MKKLRTYVFQPPQGKGSAYASISCVDDRGVIDSAIVNTLLSTIRELSSREYELFESLMSGRHRSHSAGRPDWAGNECVAWFGEPRAGKGHVLIANQNVPEYSEEDGEPQRFTFEQVGTAMRVWRDFRSQVAREGVMAMLGSTTEVPFPEPHEE